MVLPQRKKSTTVNQRIVVLIHNHHTQLHRLGRDQQHEQSLNKQGKGKETKTEMGHVPVKAAIFDKLLNTPEKYVLGFKISCNRNKTGVLSTP